MELFWQDLGWTSSCSAKSILVDGVCDDTRQLKKNNAFFAYDGTHVMGKDFCFEALQKGAAGVFLHGRHQHAIEQDARFEKQLPIFFSPKDFFSRAGKTMQTVLGHPAQKLCLIGITGTNGKTTIANSIFQLYLPHASFLGTIGKKIGNELAQASNLTTPSPAEVHNFINESLLYNIKTATMECSSHGIAQGRVAGIDWSFLIFTNLSQDHLDFHQTMENYYLCKKKIFQTWQGSAIINTDDDYGQRLYNELKRENPSYKIYDYGFNAQHFRILSWQADLRGYRFSMSIDKKEISFSTSFLGKFNIYNLSAVIALAVLKVRLQSESELNLLAEKIKNISPVCGRMQTIAKHCLTIVDYAHTPDALQKALETIAEMKPKKIFCVFGCGGERDKKKRPLMGKIATDLAEHVIITNDNPRSEEPNSIAQEIFLGAQASARFQNTTTVEVILDRREAILRALQTASVDDVILVAGKGHEDYQILASGRISFSDQKVIETYECKT